MEYTYTQPEICDPLLAMLSHKSTHCDILRTVGWENIRNSVFIDDVGQYL